MRRVALIIGAVAALAVVAVLLLPVQVTVTSETSTSPGEPIVTEDAAQDGLSGFAERQIADFIAAGAGEPLVRVLREIAAGGPVSQTALDAVPPETLAEVYRPVQVSFGSGSEASALSFAMGLENTGAVAQMLDAGAPPMAGQGHLPLVAVRYSNRDWNGLERDWSVSLATLEAYFAAGGDPDFASETENLPLFVIALNNGNVPAANRLREGGADVWARSRGSGQTPGLLRAMDYHHDTMRFIIEAAEGGAFARAPEGATEEVIAFYARGFLDEDGDRPDPSFAKSGLVGVREDIDKAELVLALFRALEPLAPENVTLQRVLSFDDASGD